MYRISYFVLAVVLCLSLSVSWTGYGVAKDQVTPEQGSVKNADICGDNIRRIYSGFDWKNERYIHACVGWKQAGNRFKIQRH